MTKVHPSAIVHPRAELGADVEIGPFSVVEPGVRIGDRTRLAAHVVVCGDTTIGADNRLHPFSVIGGEAQLRKSGEAREGDRPRLVLGDRNVVREHVTINVASLGGETRIGGDNLFMSGCHVAHDVTLGSHCVVANGVQLAGHVVVEDWVTFGGLAAVAQRLRVGESAFVAGGAMCERSVLPFVIVQGDRARVRGLNVVGLARRGVPEASIASLRAAFVALFGGASAGFDAAFVALSASGERRDPWVDRLACAIEGAAREGSAV